MSATYFLDLNGYALKENSKLPDIIEQAASGAADRHRLVELLTSYIFQMNKIS
ncbi:TPA: hypothetical protein ACK8SK_002616 [Legionella pneumophila]|nr:hypothetical protein [Legionella pneumophila]